MGQHFQTVLKLLADGKLDEAEREASALESVISDMEEDHQLIEEMIERARGDQPKPTKGSFKLKIRKRVVAIEDRSDLIKSVAYDIAKANSGKASTTAIAKVFDEKNLDLRTKVPGTMIGNVLFKDKPNWEWVERGVFKYVGLPK